MLYRTNSQSRLFEEAMRRYQLKYHVVGGFSFYERAEIKDMISYLKVIHNPDDSISLLRVINTPARGIGKTTMETVERVALETGLSLWGAIGEVIKRQLLPQRALGGAEELSRPDRRCPRHGWRELMSSAWTATAERKTLSDSRPRLSSRAKLRSRSKKQPTRTSIPCRSTSAADEAEASRPPSDLAGRTDDERQPRCQPDSRLPHSRRAAHTAELLKFLIDRTGYIKQLEEEDTPEAYSRIENLRELVNAAMDSSDRGETLDQFLDHAALVSDADAYDERAQITLMTLHAAKGLEFPLVFLADWKRACFRTRALSSSPTTSKKNAGSATSA